MKTTVSHVNHPSLAIWTLTLLALAWAPAQVVAEARGAAQDEPQEQMEALGRALGMTPEEVETLGLSPEEIDNLLAGFSEETVVVGSRARPRTVTASPVPVDVLSTSELSSQGSVNLQDQLRTVVPSFAVNMQPISDASTVVRPAMLRNLAPDHTLVLVNGKRRHRSSIIDWHGGNGVAFGSQGPDISAIPAIALRQVEVLRDGAAAQYCGASASSPTPSPPRRKASTWCRPSPRWRCAATRPSAPSSTTPTPK